MADNVDTKTASNVPVATDVVTYSGDANQNVQLMRPVLVTGSEGSKTVVDLPGEATNGLDVDVTRVIPGTTATALGKAEDAAHTDADVGVLMLGVRNYAGAGTDGDYSAFKVNSEGMQEVIIRRDHLRIAVASAGLTIATTAYTAGDQVGSQFTFANAARASGGSGIITGCVLICDADIIGAYDLVVTDASITLAADNAAYAISDTDSERIVGVIPLSGAIDLGNNRVCQSFNLAIPYTCNGGTSLFGGLITRAGHTFFAATSDITMVLYVERN